MRDVHMYVCLFVVGRHTCLFCAGMIVILSCSIFAQESNK